MRPLLMLAFAGCGRLAFDPSEARDAAPIPDIPTTFSGPTADPLQLPIATGQVEPAPPAAALSAGESYLDPTTNVRIWKLTDAGTPGINAAGRVDREAGGPLVSAAWDGDHHTIALILDDGAGTAQRWLVDLQRGVGLSNPRLLAVQGSEDLMTFSSNPETPRVMYAGSVSGFHRIDSETNAKANVAPFPVADVYTLPVMTAGGRVIVVQRVDGGYIAIDTLAGTTESIAIPADIPPSVDHGGTYVTQRTSGTSELWRVGDDTTTTWKPPTGDFAASTGVSGGILSVDVDTGSGGMAIYLSDPATRTHQMLGDYGAYDAVVMSGQWIQTDVPLMQQWVLFSVYEEGFSPPGRIDDAIGFMRLDGEYRLLCHHHSPDNAGYYQQTRPSISPDGRIVVFSSTMGTARTDVYAVEVPLLP